MPFICARTVGEVRGRLAGSHKHLREAMRVYEERKAAVTREREVKREREAIEAGLAEPSRGRAALQSVADLRKVTLQVQAKADEPLGIKMAPLRLCTVKLGGLVIGKAMSKSKERAEAKAVREALLTLKAQL